MLGPDEVADTLLADARHRPDSYRAFYDHTRDDVITYFRWRVLDPEITAELVAETYAQLLRDLRRWTPRRGDARAYLFSIAQHRLIDWRRHHRVEQRHRRRLALTTPPWNDGGIDDADHRVDAHALAPQLWAAIAELTDTERTALELRVCHQLPYRDIADRLGCSEGAARVRVSRALTHLSDTIEPHTPTT